MARLLDALLAHCERAGRPSESSPTHEAAGDVHALVVLEEMPDEGCRGSAGQRFDTWAECRTL